MGLAEEHCADRRALIMDTMGEARRFLRAAQAAFDACAPDAESLNGGPKNAAMKRASLDLTKKLAELRRPG